MEINNNLSKYQSGTVTCTYVNSTTLYGKITHTLGEQYICMATLTYSGDSPLTDILDLSVITMRGNNYVEFYVKGSGFTNSSGMYVDFLLIGK